ncbi:MAG: hypothetical protein LQ340_002618 [Diploschistes diacapsis]|nr:MAG: hypothetical protein LQ340_002618 [Diploschistes diacapsis]
MSTSVNPVLALVPGAFHSPVHYAKLIQLLEEAGYETATRQNASTGSTDATTADVHADVEAIREMVLLPQLNAGKGIVLVVHSYGGCPAGAAAEGLSKAKRSAAGQSGGIIGIIFIAAFIAQEGESLISKLPGQVLEPWHKLDVRGTLVKYSCALQSTLIWSQEASGQLSVIDPKTILYADVKAPADQTAISQLKNQSLISFKTSASTPAWKDPYMTAAGRTAVLCRIGLFFRLPKK